jgi:hypothetical protein
MQQPAYQSALLYDPRTEGEIGDVVSCGMHFLNEIRNNPKYGVDKKFCAMLKNPFPHIKKPFALKVDAEIPREMTNYFATLSFHVNKSMAIVYIWLDLCKWISQSLRFPN